VHYQRTAPGLLVLSFEWVNHGPESDSLLSWRRGLGGEAAEDLADVVRGFGDWWYHASGCVDFGGSGVVGAYGIPIVSTSRQCSKDLIAIELPITRGLSLRIPNRAN